MTKGLEDVRDDLQKHMTLASTLLSQTQQENEEPDEYLEIVQKSMVKLVRSLLKYLLDCIVIEHK